MANPYTTLVNEIDTYLTNFEQELQNPLSTNRRVNEIIDTMTKNLGHEYDLAFDANKISVHTCANLIAAVSKVNAVFTEANSRDLKDPDRELSKALELLTEVAARSCRFSLIPRLSAFFEIYRDAALGVITDEQEYDEYKYSPYAEHSREYRS